MTEPDQRQRREDTRTAPYALAYLRHLAGERTTLPDPGYWGVTADEAPVIRERVRALVAAAGSGAR